MANKDTEGKRPRIRKSAPTLRERQEAAAVKAESPKKKPVKKLGSTAAKPFKKLRLGDRKAVQVAVKPFKFVGRGLKWLVPRYFINSWREVRLVVWPSRKETWRLTLAVFIFAIVFGAMVAAVDKGLDEIFKKVVLK